MRIAMLALAAFIAALPALAQQGPETLGSRISGEHGRYLTDGQGRAVYLFRADRQGTDGQSPESACHESCATLFPPVAVQNLPRATEGVEAELIGSFRREDGRTQLTYNGWPLYYYVADQESKAAAAGFDKPQFGGEWRLVGLSGHPAVPEWRNPFAGIGFKKPECVRHVADGDYYLVSNVNGEFTEADNNGFITRVERDGRARLKWIAGGVSGVTLNAPTGIELSGGRIYVADIDHVRVFDAANGAHLGDVKIDGAKFLNDLAMAPGGPLYVTDTGTASEPGAIYAIDGRGDVRRVAAGPGLNRPNGIALGQDGNLRVVTYAADELMTITPGGEIVETQKIKSGKLDGILLRSDGGVLVSSWGGSSIIRVTPDGGKPVLTGVDAPACFDVEEAPGGPRLLVPQVHANKVAVAPLAPEM